MGRVHPAVRRHRVPWYRRAARDPAAARYWAGVVVLALLVAAAVGRAVGRADDARAAWGETRAVLVVHRSVAAGDPLEGAVRTERWPRRLVPGRAVADLPTDARATAAMAAGTPLTEVAIRAPGEGSAPEGRQTVSVPLPQPTLDLAAGDVVDLWVVTDALELDVDRARRVAGDARVVSVDTGAAVVAVRPSEVADVAEAAATGTVVPVGRR